MSSGDYDQTSPSDTSLSGVSATSEPDEDYIEPDILGVFTGPEADAVLARSHAHWQQALAAAEDLSPGEFPGSAFDIEQVLQRIPALPKSISVDQPLQGYSTWTNDNSTCHVRERRELPHSFRIRAAYPCPLRFEDSENFQKFCGNANNGIAILMLAWAYILNASFAERLPASATTVLVGSDDCSIESTANSDRPIVIDFEYATAEEAEWWRILTGPGWIFTRDDAVAKFFPWSLYADLGTVEIQTKTLDRKDKNHKKVHHPSPEVAASYLARFISVYDLEKQNSAALSAVISSHLVRTRLSPSISVPRLNLPKKSRANINDYPRYPLEYSHLPYFMALSLSSFALESIFKNIAWNHNVTCNHAGNWIRPLRNIIAPLISSGQRELLAKFIITSGAKAPSLWLGLLICGVPPYFTKFLDAYLYSRKTLDMAAWTGIAGSFLVLESPKPPLQEGHLWREDVWRLRRDLSDKYEEDDFTYEPLGPYAPFGSMEPKDMELELHSHLDCTHRWRYAYWTWLHDSTTDIGLHPSVDNFSRDPVSDSSPSPDFIAECVGQYSKNEDLKAIRRISRNASEWTFKWCANQIEYGFSDTVVPLRRSPTEIPLSESDDAKKDWSNKMARTRKWLSELGSHTAVN